MVQGKYSEMVIKFKEQALGSRTASVTVIAAFGLSLWLVLKLWNRSSPSEPSLDTEDDAKVIVNDTAEISICKACLSMIAVYERIDNEFVSGGLDSAAIRSIQPWFHGVNDGGLPWPKRYSEFPEPLPEAAVRLLVIPLDDSPSIAAAAAAITKDVLEALPFNSKVFCNARTNYHCTVFHTSHPSDPRPDPFAVDSGLNHLTMSPSRRPGPKPVTLAAEVEAVSGVVSRSRAPSLIVDRVLMAASGTLLLTWVDPSGRLGELRAELKEAFPGACSKQASIVHSSLLRIISDDQLDRGTIQEIEAICKRWTEKLRGRVFKPSETWWIKETEFSTIVGERLRMKFGNP